MLRENQEKFHGFSIFGIILLVYFLEFLLYHYLTRYDMGRQCPYMVVNGTYVYTIPPPQTQLAQLKKTVKPTLKKEKFVIRTPHQALIQDFDLRGVG